MIKLKLILSLFVLTMTLQHAFAQTKLIAHKSHSGKKSTLSYLKSDGNFGADFRVVSITRISSKAVVVFYDYGRGDTLRDKKLFKNPQLALDSLKVLYPDSGIEFIGFEPIPAKKKGEGFFFGLLDPQDPSFGPVLLITALAGLMGLFGFGVWRMGNKKLKPVLIRS